MAADKNIKITADQLHRFDTIMKSELPLKSSRFEMFEKLLIMYESGCNTEPTIKEVIKEVDVSPNDVPSSKMNQIKKTIIANCSWIIKHTQYIPTTQGNITRNKVTEIIESANAL